MQTQGSNNKDSYYSKKSKSKNPKLIPLYDNVAKPTKRKDKKDKKKKFQKQK